MAHFDTRQYENSHGHKPRPTQTGCWAFMPENSADPDDWLFSPTMSYAQARAWAEGERPDVEDFVVGP